MPESSVSEYQAFARPKIEAGGYAWEVFRKQIQQESGWRHLDTNGNVKTSYTGSSKGISQLNQNFYPPEVWQDAWTNLSKGIELATGYLARFGSHRKALAAFNWGPGNVGGYTKPDGTVVPAWNGRRETISDQGRHYLDVILGSAWDEPAAPAPAAAIVYQDFRDPEPAGRFASMPKGIILHGSRSGVAGNPKAKEYLGTARYEVSNPNDLGWHATIGEGVVAVHLTPQEWGWHALQASKVYMGVEIAQATADEPVTDAQVDALADYIKTRVLLVWPKLPMHFPSHAEADREFGVNQGKTDAFPLGDPRMDDLRARLMARLGSTKPAPVPGGTLTEAEATALRAENARLQEKVDGFVNALAFLGDDQADKLQDIVGQLRRVREQFVGPRA